MALNSIDELIEQKKRITLVGLIRQLLKKQENS